MGCCKVVEGRRKQGPVRCEHPAAISAGEVAAQGAREQACRAFSLAESDRPTRQILVARGAALLRKMRVSLKFIELPWPAFGFRLANFYRLVNTLTLIRVSCATTSALIDASLTVAPGSHSAQTLAGAGMRMYRVLA